MNNYMVIGNLVRDPETGTTESGINWCRFVVAVRRRHPKPGEADAEFVRVTAWRGRGDTCAKFLQKGKKVYVSGEPRAHAWISRDNEARGEIEMNADEVEFLSSAGSGRADPSDEDAPPAAARDEQTGMEVTEPEELPF